MRRSLEDSSPDSSADGSYATVVEVRQNFLRTETPSASAAEVSLKRSSQSAAATNLAVTISDENDNNLDVVRAFSPPELPAPTSYRDLHHGSASSSNSSVCSEGTQIWVPPLGHSSAASSAPGLPQRRGFDYRNFHPLQTLPEASSRRVTVDVHCDAADSPGSSPRSSVIHSVSQSASPVNTVMRPLTPPKVSPSSAFSVSTGSSNNARLSANTAAHSGSSVPGLSPFAFPNSHINESPSSSAVAQFDIQPLPQLQFVNRLEHNSILELRQISTSSNGSNNTNMINVDSGISNTSPETQSSTELFHPVNYHPSRHFAEGHRMRPFPHIPPSMLSSIPSSASGAIVQSGTPTEFLDAEQFQARVNTPSSSASQQSNEPRSQPLASPFVLSGLTGQPPAPPPSQLTVRRRATLPTRTRETNAARAPQSILKATAMPAVQMQIAFKATLFSILSIVYSVTLCILGLLFPLVELAAGRQQAAVYEKYYVVLYTFGICFLGYVYVYLLRERDVRRKVQKARLFIRTSLLTQRRLHSVHLRNATAPSVDAIAMQRLNATGKSDKRFAEQPAKHSRSIDGMLVRLTVVLLGVVCIVYDGLDFAHRLVADSPAPVPATVPVPVAASKTPSRNVSLSPVINSTAATCSGFAFSARPLLQLCFIFVQLYFIFLNSKMRVLRYQALARFGLTHMLVCNVCIWFLAFVNEISNDYERLSTFSNRSTDKILTTCLLRRGMVGEALTSSSPYLYYCVVEYSVFAISILISMWRNVGQTDECATSWITPSSSTTSDNVVSQGVAMGERNSVHFFDTSGNELQSQVVEPLDEFSRVQSSLQDPLLSANDSQQDAADSSSSSGMSDSDSESTLTTPITAVPVSVRPVQSHRTQTLLPMMRNSVMPQSLRQSVPVHSAMVVEQSVNSSVALTRSVTKATQQQQVLHVDCQGAHRGLFVGLFALVVSLVNIILFHVLTQKAEFVPTAFTVHYVFEISLHLLSIAAMIVAFYKMQDMLYLPSSSNRRFVAPLSHSVFSSQLIAIGQSGVILLVCANFAALPLAFEQQHSVAFYSRSAVLPSYQTVVLFICTNLLSLLQSVCQSVFTLTGLRRMSYKMLHKRERPGRDYVTFLVLYNLSMFLVDLFEFRRLLLLTFTVNYFGVLLWLVIVHISIPLVVFYRLQSTLCLIRIWKTAYKFKSI